MKTNVNARMNRKVIPYRKPKAYAYPGCADRRYYLNKALDYALTVATSLGTVTILMFLMTLR